MKTHLSAQCRDASSRSCRLKAEEKETEMLAAHDRTALNNLPSRTRRMRQEERVNNNNNNNTPQMVIVSGIIPAAGASFMWKCRQPPSVTVASLSCFLSLLVLCCGLRWRELENRETVVLLRSSPSSSRPSPVALHAPGTRNGAAPSHTSCLPMTSATERFQAGEGRWTNPGVRLSKLTETIYSTASGGVRAPHRLSELEGNQTPGAGPVWH
ncbi:unnamed protein product [Pleuronectes platessa]|uniref:Uncharacterized protein n=1 Tax=Pleuronectes platessa TaxID=8262 RepID=A0A9N7Z3X6_PLEPL|nr:unnamed protein product [Pleuronectes platessa]